MSDEKLKIKDYTSHSDRVLNRAIRLREKQIAKALDNKGDSQKSLAQLRYELEAMTNTLMERSMTRSGGRRG